MIANMLPKCECQTVTVWLLPVAPCKIMSQVLCWLPLTTHYYFEGICDFHEYDLRHGNWACRNGIKRALMLRESSESLKVALCLKEQAEDRGGYSFLMQELVVQTISHLQANRLFLCNLVTIFLSISIPLTHPDLGLCTNSKCSHLLAVIQVCNQNTHRDTHTQKLQPARLISLEDPARTLNHVIRKLIQSPKQGSGRWFLFIHLIINLVVKWRRWCCSYLYWGTSLSFNYYCKIIYLKKGQRRRVICFYKNTDVEYRINIQ